jgi:hypothetical protein
MEKRQTGLFIVHLDGEEIQFLLNPHKFTVGTDLCNKRQINRRNTSSLMCVIHMHRRTSMQGNSKQ